jgi:hypothetical protein
MRAWAKRLTVAALVSLLVTISVAAIAGDLAFDVTRLTAAQQAPPVSSKFKIAQSSLKCGIPPIPPIGCRVGSCACDQNGNNCHWTYVCN